MTSHLSAVKSSCRRTAAFLFLCEIRTTKT
nr:MAG TPA: hypothetical protein [Caudoviricetes sp.]